MKSRVHLLIAAVFTALYTVPAQAILIEVTIRDFSDSHPDFESVVATDPGIVEITLGADGKPVYAGENGNPTTHGKSAFDQWYRDVPGVNSSTMLDLDFTETTPGILQYANPIFFPIDNMLLGNEGRDHNYHFTLELNSEFTYMGGESFGFTGDDDLWVFINDQLVIDLGGVHGALTDEVSLDAQAASLGISVGNTYSLDLFFAERHTSASNFNVTTGLQLSNPPMGVPEPMTAALLGLGICVLALRRKSHSGALI